MSSRQGPPSSAGASTTRETGHLLSRNGASFRFWYPTPAICAQEFRGHLEMPLARTAMERMSARMALGTVIFYADWAGMLGYDTACRIEMTRWARENRPSLKAIYVLVASKLVHMGITVASLALGDVIQSFTNRSAWESALSADVARGTEQRR